MSDKKLVNKKNKLLKRISIFFGTLLVLVILMALAAPVILKIVIAQELRKVGFPEAEVKSAYLTPAGFDLQGIILTSDLRNKIGYLRIETTIPNLIKGRANNIIIDRTSLDIVKLQDILEQSEENASAKDDPLPFDKLWIRHSEWFYKNVTLSLKGQFEKQVNSPEYHLSAAYGVLDEKFELHGVLKGSYSQTDQYDIKMDLDKFVSKDAQYQAKRLTGNLSMVQKPEAKPSIQGQIDIGHLQLGNIPLQTVQMQTLADHEKFNVIINAQMPNDAAKLTVDMNGTYEDKAQAAIHMTLNDLSKLHHVQQDWSALTQLSGRGEIATNFTMALKDNDAHDFDLASSFNIRDFSYGDIVDQAKLVGRIYKAAQENDMHIEIEPSSFVQARDAKLTLDTEKKLKARLSDVLKPVKAFSLFIPAIKVVQGRKSLKLPEQINVTGRYDGEKQNVTDLSFTYAGALYAHLNDLHIRIGKVESKILNNDGKLFNIKTNFKEMVVEYLKMQPVTKLYGRLDGDFSTEKAELKLYADDGVGQFIIKSSLSKTKEDYAIEASLHPLKFDGVLYSLKEAFPFVNKWQIGNETGEIGANLTLEYEDGSWKKQFAQLMVKDFGFDTEYASIGGVNTVVETEQLFPLKLSAQKIFIAGSDFVAPLENIFVEYEFDQQKQKLAIEDFSLGFAKGVMKLNDVNLYLNKEKQVLDLKAKNVDLLTLFNQTNLKGIEASGHLNGHAQIGIFKTQPYIRILDGILESNEAGYFKYSPSEMPAFLRNPTNIGLIQLKQALNNFHYDEIRLLLDVADQKSQQIKLKAIGKNPDFYDGKPIHINLNLEGQVENVLRQNLQTYQVPDQIKEKLEAYQNNAE